MKDFLTAVAPSRIARTAGAVLIAAGVAIAYSVGSSSTGIAQDTDVDGMCTETICHKGRQTLTLPCNDFALRRHRAHGDTSGPCPGSITDEQIDPAVGEVQSTVIVPDQKLEIVIREATSAVAAPEEAVITSEKVISDSRRSLATAQEE